MKNRPFALVLIISLFVLMTLPASAFASNLSIAKSSGYTDDDPQCLSKKDMKGIDIGMAYASADSLPMWFYCDAFESNRDTYDEVKVTVSIKKPGKKFKKVKKFKVNELSYLDNYDEDEEFACDFKIRNLKPHTKYVVKVDCESYIYGHKRSFTRSFWTAFKDMPATKAKKNGNKYEWSKVKGASGYIARYRLPVYLGKNKYGVNMWKFKYAAKIVSSPSVKLANKYELTDIIPFYKVEGFYYIHMVKVTDSKAKVLKRFKMTTDIIYN